MSRLYNILNKLVTRLKVMEVGGIRGLAVPANSYVDTNITFTETYSVAPYVIASLCSTSESPTIGNMSVAVAEVTTTRATIRVFNPTGTQRAPAVNWMAIAP